MRWIVWKCQQKTPATWTSWRGNIPPEAVSEAIVNLTARLELPKGTEHFISDIHGEYEAFCEVVSHASGAIQRRIAELFDEPLSDAEKANLGALIYAPEKMMGLMLPSSEEQRHWYREILLRLIRVLRSVSSKYPSARVRRLIEGPFEALVEELLYEQDRHADKCDYYEGLIDAIIRTGNAKAMIIVIAKAIQCLAIDHLHVVGDIYDRGPGAHLILDRLMDCHSVDVQWGNHDILWMGAAGGSVACMANVLRISLRHNNMEALENGYAISLLPLASFAIETYGDDPCECFLPQGGTPLENSEGERMLMARMHKAITIIQFKLEARIIQRRLEYGLSDRLLLDKLDGNRGTVSIDQNVYPLRDNRFPTVKPQDPYALTPSEQQVVERLQSSFLNSQRLQRHARFLFAGFFEWLRRSYPDRVGLFIGFNNELAHRIEAGADIFLMPSLFEPCGLNQIYGLKYGTLPIVRQTGGLADTIQDGVNGFAFFDFEAHFFFDAVKRAIDVYRKEPHRWEEMRATAMAQDFSWKRSAGKYLDVYHRLLGA